MESNALNVFNTAIETLSNVDSIYLFLKENAPHIDASTLLRAKFILLISALDTYIHTIISDNLADGFMKKKDFDCKININLKLAYDMSRCMDDELKRQKLHFELINILKEYSFQSPKSIEYAMSILKIGKIWSKISDKLCDTPENIKNKLSLYIMRRNQIAHESDFNKVINAFNDISYDDIYECQVFIKQFVYALEDIINTEVNKI